jgi:hypothetical protein
VNPAALTINRLTGRSSAAIALAAASSRSSTPVPTRSAIGRGAAHDGMETKSYRRIPAHSPEVRGRSVGKWLDYQFQAGPPSQWREIDGGSDSFVDRAFADPESLLGIRTEPLSRLEVFARVTRGGFPEAVLAASDADRRDFFADYARTVMTRDVGEIADLEDTSRFRQMVRVLAARTATELNYSDIARAVEIPLATMRRYLPLFRPSTFIISFRHGRGTSQRSLYIGQRSTSLTPG